MLISSKYKRKNDTVFNTLCARGGESEQMEHLFIVPYYQIIHLIMYFVKLVHKLGVLLSMKPNSM